MKKGSVRLSVDALFKIAQVLEKPIELFLRDDPADNREIDTPKMRSMRKLSDLIKDFTADMDEDEVGWLIKSIESCYELHKHRNGPVTQHKSNRGAV